MAIAKNGSIPKKALDLRSRPRTVLQVNEEPGEEDVGGIGKSEITQRNQQHLFAPQNRPPWDGLGRGGSSRHARQSGPDVFGLPRSHPGMLLGAVPRQQVPDQARRQPDRRADPEGPAPAPVQQKIGDEGRRNSGARAHPGEDPSVSHPAFRGRDPACHHPVGRGIDRGYPHAQTEAQCQQKGQRGGDARGRHRRQAQEHGPPDGCQRENPARPETVGQAARGRLEQGIPQREDAEDPAELDLAQMEFL